MGATNTGLNASVVNTNLQNAQQTANTSQPPRLGLNGKPGLTNDNAARLEQGNQAATGGIQPQQPMTGFGQSLGRLGQGLGNIGQGLQSAVSGGGTASQNAPVVYDQMDENYTQNDKGEWGRWGGFAGWTPASGDDLAQLQAGTHPQQVNRPSVSQGSAGGKGGAARVAQGNQAAAGGKGGGTQAAQQQAVQPQPVQQGPNIFQSASQGINAAMGGAAQGMAYQPMQVSSPTYNAAQSQGQGYDAAQATGFTGQAQNAQAQGFDAANVGSTGYGAQGVGSQGYNAAQAGSQGYQAQNAQAQGFGAAQAGSQGYNAAQSQFAPNVTAQSVQAGQIGKTDLSQYMNPYTENVIQTSLSDIERSRQLAANQSAAAAQRAGAFGGSRQAIMEAESNRNFLQQAA